MFHIGKVRKVVRPKKKDVVSADSSVQAVVRMWDQNLLMLQVHKKIEGKIKENDFIIADYTPVAPNSPHRKMMITKIVKGDLGKKIYKEFTDEYERRKSKADAAVSAHEEHAAMPYIR